MDWGPRLVLAVGVLAGLSQAVLFPLRHPEQVALATDVYYHAARAALAGADFYAVAPPEHPGYTFLYPPALVLAFLAHGLLGDPALAYALQTALNLAAGGVLAVLVVRFVERERERVSRAAGHGVSGPVPDADAPDSTFTRLDRLLVGGYVLASVAAVSNLVMGQVNLPLALAVAGCALLLERGRETGAGVALGAAAAVKLFPALVGVWLLRQRAWRAVAAAALTGVAVVLAGLLAFGVGPTEAYVVRVLPREMAVASFTDGPDPAAPYATIRRQLTALAPWLPADWLPVVGATVLAPVVAGVNRTVADRRSRLVALQGTLLATLTLFPLEPFYLVLTTFPLVPLLSLLPPGRPRGLILAGALLVSVPVTYDGVLAVAATPGLPPSVGATLRAVAGATFAFALPPTCGVWLVLAGCLLYQHRAVRRAREEAGIAESGDGTTA